MDSPATNDVIAKSPELMLDELERRVRLLEDTVARLSERLPQVKAGPSADAQVVEDRIHERASPHASAPPESAAASRSPVADGWDVPPPRAWGGGWASWLYVDMLREARLLVRMLLDPRYSLAWTTRITAVIFLPAVLTAHLWLPLILFWFPLMWFEPARGLTINFVNLLLAFALYKALSREVRRYQDYVRGPTR